MADYVGIDVIRQEIGLSSPGLLATHMWNKGLHGLRRRMRGFRATLKSAARLEEFMIVWLAAYPRSGNTLLQLFLKQVFGVHTFSLYDDPLT